MSNADVFAPGRHRVTPAELFSIGSATKIVSEWQDAMDVIEAAERAAENEEASIRIR